MIKVSVMYPHETGARFDHDYYRDTHMKLVQRLLGAACTYYTIERGLSGGEPGSLPTYLAMCHIYSKSLEIYGAAIAKSGGEILADIANYTDLAPVIQVSEVIVERSEAAAN